MKIFRQITLKYLKKNKIRTIVAIIGILFSAAMICAVTTFISSMNHYIVENAIQNTGDWQAGVLDVDWETYDSLSQQSEITDIVGAQRIGYAIITQLEYEYKCYYYLLGVKKEFMDTMGAHITSGRMPRESFEILLPESLYEVGGVKYKIGDKMVLETGKRKYKSVELWQDDPYTFHTTELDRELFSREKTRLYTVVGFYDDLSYKIESASAPGYTVFTYFEEEPLWKEGYKYDVYFNIKNSQKIYDFAKENGLTAENNITPEFNTDVLGIASVLQLGGSKGMAVVVIVFVMSLIIVGAIALIYNMFAISVSERTKQFALLSSMGATQKQIRGMVLYESLVVSVVGIPLGIITGIGGIWVALQFVGDKFQALGYIIPMTIHVSGTAVWAAAILSFVTVLISAWIPSKRAMEATIIETIRQNNDIYQNQKENKMTDMIQKVFGLSGMLAERYCNRSKKKYQATVLSLFISAILFVLVSFFMDYLLKVVEHSFRENSYDVAFYYKETELTGYDKDEFFELLKTQENITDAVYTTSTKTYRAEIDKKYLSDWALENEGTLTRSYRLKPEVVSLNINVAYVQDEAFLELLNKYGLNKDEYMNPEAPKAIVVDGVLNSSTNANVRLLAGDECIVTFARAIFEMDTMYTTSTFLSEKLMYNLEGGKTIYERPYYVEGEDGLMFLYPESVRRFYIGKYPEKGDVFDTVVKLNDHSRLVEDNMCNCKFLSDDANASYEALKQIAEEHNLNTNNFQNNAEQIEKEKNLISIIEVLSLGFIVLMSLIAAINVFNTISSNISLRRREFAVLKSIGMTEKSLNRMLFVECILLSAKSLLYGLPVALIGTVLIHLIATVEYSVAYHFPWEFMGIAVAVIFVITLICMFYIRRTRKKENVIEALKNENI